MRPILAQPRLRLFYLGNAVSTMGDYALWLALGVWVKELTGSTSLAGLNFLALIVGTLLSPLTGLLVDRFPRKPLLISANLATGGALLALLAVHDRRLLWLIYLVTFLYGMLSTVITNTQQALVKLMVPADLLAAANGLQQTLAQGLRLVTPLLGVGLLGWLGAHAVVTLDVATFVIAVICLCAVRVSETAERMPRRHWVGELSAGFAFVRRSAQLRRLTVAFAATMLCLGFSETLGFQVVTIGLRHAPTWLGVLVTIQGIGALCGGLTAAVVARKIGDARLTACGVAMFCVASVALAAPSEAVVFAGAILAGVGLPWFIVGGMTIFQKATPADLIGRVLGAADLAIQAPQAIGIGAGAALVAILDYRVICGLMAVILATTAAVFVIRQAAGPAGAADTAGSAVSSVSA